MIVAALALAAALETGKVSGPIACANDPKTTYVYYLPTAYAPEKKWPLLFIFDARKRGALSAELFREAAERYGWILASSNDTHSDVDPAASTHAIREMWRDVPQRFSIDRNRVYAGGFSGGAMFSWWFIKGTNSAGVIGVGGRLAEPKDTENVKFDWYGIAGSTDFNYIETRSIEKKLARAGTAYRTEYFEGRHGWPAPDFLRRAVEWHELQAMRRGTRARDEKLIADLLADDMTRAAAETDPLVASRHYAAIVRTFEGLADVDGARAKGAALENSTRKLVREEQRAEEFERNVRARLQDVITRFMQDETPKTEAWLVRELDLDHLLGLAKEQSYRGFAARRAIASIYTNLNFYLPRELRARQRTKELAVVTAVARRIHPEPR